MAVHALYLWRLSPVVGWLNDRVLAAFGRSEAPILSGVPGLGPDQAIFVFSGLVPNQKSHPLVYEWIAVSFRGAEFSELTPFETLLQRTGLGRRAVPNLQQPADMAALLEAPSGGRPPRSCSCACPVRSIFLSRSAPSC